MEEISGGNKDGLWRVLYIITYKVFSSNYLEPRFFELNLNDIICKYGICLNLLLIFTRLLLQQTVGGVT